MTATLLQHTQATRPRLTVVGGDRRASGTISVVIAHGQKLARAGLRVLLEREVGLDVIGEAADGDEVVAIVRDLRPDVVLVDVQLPGLDCVEATRQMLAESPVAVMVLTSTERDSRVFGARRAGAAGHLLADRGPAELVGAVRLLAHRGRMFSRRSRSHRQSRRAGWSSPT